MYVLNSTIRWCIHTHQTFIITPLTSSRDFIPSYSLFFAESLLIYSLSSENAGWSDYDFLFSAMFIHLDGSFYNPLIFWQQNTELQHRSKRCSSSQSERMYCIHELLRSLFFYIDNSVFVKLTWHLVVSQHLPEEQAAEAVNWHVLLLQQFGLHSCLGI